MDDGRQDLDRARHARDGGDRPDRSREGRRRDGRAHAEGLSGLRRGLRGGLGIIRRYLDGFTNLQVAGRNGMHKYNNQDHSMVTAMLSVQNLLGGHHDVWAVNADDEYHEETDLGETLSHDQLRALQQTQPAVPRARQ